jgi:hypothetical protein
MVAVDGVDRGMTPAIVGDLPAGPHILTLRLEGYDESRLQVSVGPGATTSLAVNLTPSAPFMNQGSPLFLLVVVAILLGIAALVVLGIYFFRKR